MGKVRTQKPEVPADQTEDAGPDMTPVRINVGPEMHLYEGERYGPGVVTLDPSEGKFVDEGTGEFDQKKFNKVKNALIRSTVKTHEANQKRLGILASETKGTVRVRDLQPPPIHQTLPDVTGTPDTFGSPPITEVWSATPAGLEDN